MAKQQSTKDLFKAIEANDIKRAFSILAAYKNDIDYTYQHKGKTLLMFLCSRYITFSLASDNAGCKNYEEYRDKMISFLNLLIMSARDNNALNIADENGKTTLMYLTEKISYVEDPSFIHAISSQIKNGG
ncbi:MAG: hypothetical protein VX335_03850, partial [Pseudomonadota bacterium]|nr:hypothetical protein [Pseudomonadota bacterium]